jgi:uncharacterized NAD-dependent epimerase/dehydratase family protein
LNIQRVNAIVFCEGAFASTYGKTAHGLVRFTRRYNVATVIDSTLTSRAGTVQDAGEFLDRKPAGIPIVAGVGEALKTAVESGRPATHFVVGIAVEGRQLPESLVAAATEALEAGLHIHSGLHVFLSEYPPLARIAGNRGLTILDIRKPPAVDKLHFFSGRIEEVGSFRTAILGTDSAIGKRTTAWLIIQELEKRGLSSELIGTGQTAWMQGADYSLIMDSLINDFVAGEIEHAVLSAWDDKHPAHIIVEGQGSLMNPAFPGGFEILAAARPHCIVLQHAPARKEYDGFPGFPLHPLTTQIQALELISGKTVVAVSVNHQGLNYSEVPGVCRRIQEETGLPCTDPLLEGPERLVDAILKAAK